MNTPYTTRTGLRIGCKVEAPTRHEYHDSDDLRLQAALLGNRPAIDWDGIYIVGAVLLVILAIAFWS